jgi:RND family efflux transporter MFP subunit
MNPVAIPHATTRRRSALLVTAIALAASVLVACDRPPAQQAPVKPVLVTTVQNRAGGSEHSYSATLRPRYETDVGFRTGGKISQRLVEVGQRVSEGQPLARLDPADYALAVAAAADQVRAAKVDADQAASDAARFARLLGDGSIGAADHERQKARADAAAARHELATRQLDLARNRAAYATLVAPYAGVVTGLKMEAGQVVAEGQPVASLARTGELEVVADLPEHLVQNAKTDRASAELWERPGKQLALRLRELSPVASAQARTFRARFAIVDADASAGDELRIGMTAQLLLGRRDTQPSAVLPATALLKTGGAPSVWVVDAANGTLSQRPVQVIGYAPEAVVVSGLPDGLKVVSVGTQKLVASMKVVPLDRTASGLNVEGVLPAPASSEPIRASRKEQP